MTWDTRCGFIGVLWLQVSGERLFLKLKRIKTTMRQLCRFTQC